MRFAICLPLIVFPAVVNAAFAQDDPALTKALKARDMKATQEALVSIVSNNNAKAAEILVNACDRVDGDPSMYWLVVDAAASLSSEEAMTALGKELKSNSRKPFCRDIVYALQNNKAPNVTIVLGEMLMDGPPECEYMAAEFLANVPVKGAVDLLITKLEKVKGGELKQRIVDSIVNLIGKNLGDNASAYRDWWTTNREKLKDGDLCRGPEGAVRHAGGTAVETLPPGSRELERLKKGTIVVLVSDCPHAGHKDAHSDADHDLDHMQTLLTKMDLPYIEVKKSQFAKFDLTGRTALLINCNQWRRFDHGKTCKAGGASLMRLFDCVGPGPHLSHDNMLTDAAVQKIKEFVERDGGYLFTEDWVLPELLERAWPNLVRTGKYLNEMKVEVKPAVGVTSHPYMRRIFGHKAKRTNSSGTTVVSSKDFDTMKHVWKIDNESPSIRITGGDKVIKLMLSEEIGKLTAPKDPKKPSRPLNWLECKKCQYQKEEATYDPTDTNKTWTCQKCNSVLTQYFPPKPPPEPGSEGDEAVAITFFPGATPKTVVATGGYEQDRTKMVGGGRVVHVASHFGKQDSKDDEYSLQNLMLNFLLEASERRAQKVKQP